MGGHIQAAQSSILCADSNDEPIWSQAYGCHWCLMLSLYHKSHHLMLEKQTDHWEGGPVGGGGSIMKWEAHWMPAGLDPMHPHMHSSIC